MRFLVLALGLLVATNVWAAPVKVPPLKLCMNNSTGAIIAKKICKAGETVINGQVLQGLAVQGPQGPQGPAGTIDIGKCISRESTASGSDAVAATVPCLVNEFVATSGCDVGGVAVVGTHKLLKATNTLLGGEVYGLVRCVGVDPYNTGFTYSVTAQAFCCRP